MYEHSLECLATRFGGEVIMLDFGFSGDLIRLEIFYFQKCDVILKKQ